MDPYYSYVHKYIYSACIGCLEIKIGDALGGLQLGAAVMENGVEVPQKIKGGSAFLT